MVKLIALSLVAAIQVAAIPIYAPLYANTTVNSSVSIGTISSKTASSIPVHVSPVSSDIAPEDAVPAIEVAFPGPNIINDLAGANDPNSEEDIELNIDYIDATKENIDESYISYLDYHRLIASMNENYTESSSNDDPNIVYTESVAHPEHYRNRRNSLFQAFLASDVDAEGDDVCSTYSSNYMPYTGFRFIVEARLSAVFLRKRESVLVYCYQGREVTRTSKKLKFKDRDVVWGSRYCFSQEQTDAGVKKGGPAVSGCYVAARTVSSVNVETIVGFSWKRPERFYAGLFRYPAGKSAKLTNEGAIPVAPLLGDEPYMGFAVNDGRMTSRLSMPIAYTPDYSSQYYPQVSDAWAKYIDINEEYKPLVSSTWPFTNKGGFAWQLALKELLKSEALWGQLQLYYKELSWNPNLLADFLAGKATGQDLIDAGVSSDLVNAEAYGPLHFGWLQQRPADPNLRQVITGAMFDLLGNEVRLCVSQLKMRLIFIKNKKYAKFMYLVISRLLAPN